MNPPIDEHQAGLMIETAQQMLDVWQRLPAAKQKILLARFGSRDKAVAALVATRLLAPSIPAS
ncbi:MULTISPECIES: hypothetical protein [Pseudomonas]|jgi:hypothetical protein|uniref:hypothetical protein n=1 Tax=Pseudomonas TaxID=286 RepID=UPI001CFB679A|nr:MULTISPECIES: hypothetical protein [Pseudomonas]